MNAFTLDQNPPFQTVSERPAGYDSPVGAFEADPQVIELSAYSITLFQQHRLHPTLFQTQFNCLNSISVEEEAFEQEMCRSRRATSVSRNRALSG